MRMKQFITVLFSLAFLLSKAQVKTDSLLYPVVEMQGNAMAKLLLAKDYKAFIKYTYPPVVKMSGGETKLVALITKSFKELQDQGYTLTSILVGKPTAIIHFGNKLQCTVTQVVEMKTTKGRLVSVASLIGHSDNNGKNWTFIDTHGADLKTLRKSIPGLSPQLIIPPAQEPTFYAQ
jgi:hypothetical protein